MSAKEEQDILKVTQKTRPLQPSDSYPEFSKGTFAKVQLKSANAQCGKMIHYIIYIHGVVRPLPETTLSPKLMVTKYSFIADHLNLGAESPVEKEKELVLHFGTLDRMGEESDSEFICVSDIVSADTDQDRWTVSHDFQKPGKSSKRKRIRHNVPGETKNRLDRPEFRILCAICHSKRHSALIALYDIPQAYLN
jgi:hypothetical protein